MYDMNNKPIADAVVNVIGEVGQALADEQSADTEHTLDSRQTMVMGFLAGFETALHVSICERGRERMVNTLAMCMDMSIHDGETGFHEIAEELLTEIYGSMIKALAETDGAVIDLTDKTPEEASELMRMKVAELMAMKGPTKPVSDA